MFNGQVAIVTGAGQGIGFEIAKQLSALDVGHLYAVQFQVAKGVTFDLWLDDVAFLAK